MRNFATTLLTFSILLASAAAFAANFSTAVTTALSATEHPYGTAVADFNGDGYADAAMTIVDSSTTDKLRILLWNAAGNSFAVPVDLATGSIPASGPRGVVAADFNRDGKLDLAVANFNDNSVSVFLGNGDGTFQPKTDYPLGAGTGPTVLAPGDFRGVGTRQDLAVLNTNNSVAILLNNGSGQMTVQNSSTWPVTTGSPIALAVGDFNGDDIDDIAVTPNASGNVTVFKGIGIGTFASGSDIVAGNQPLALAAANFDNDGFGDLAVLNSDGTVSIVKGAESGSFPVSAPIDVTNAADNATSNPLALVALDFNRDGLTDLAVASNIKNSVSVMTGRGDGTFVTADQVTDTFATGAAPTGLAAGDFDGSGNDLLSFSSSSSNYSYQLNAFPAAAGLIVLPGAYNFGNLQIGHPIYIGKLLTLINSGTLPLSISSTTVGGDFQAVVQDGASCSTITPTIDPGGSCSILAKFQPFTYGAKSANLTFAGNAAFRPSLTVPLSGMGVQSTPYTINLGFVGRGGGSVYFSNPYGIVCTAGCSQTPSEGSTIVLTAQSASGSYLYGWSGCDKLYNGSCQIDYSVNNISDRKISVNFGLVYRPVWYVTGGTYTKTVSEAAAMASSGGTIRVAAGVFAEDLVVGSGGDITIIGGYDGNFVSQSATSRLTSLTVAVGSVTLDSIVLQ